MEWIRVVEWWSYGCYYWLYEDAWNGLECSIGSRVGFIIGCMNMIGLYNSGTDLRGATNKICIFELY